MRSQNQGSRALTACAQAKKVQQGCSGVLLDAPAADAEAVRSPHSTRTTTTACARCGMQSAALRRRCHPELPTRRLLPAGRFPTSPCGADTESGVSRGCALWRITAADTSGPAPRARRPRLACERVGVRRGACLLRADRPLPPLSTCPSDLQSVLLLSQSSATLQHCEDGLGNAVGEDRRMSKLCQSCHQLRRPSTNPPQDKRKRAGHWSYHGVAAHDRPVPHQAMMAGPSKASKRETYSAVSLTQYWCRE